jgi:hypothetical protein
VKRFKLLLDGNHVTDPENWINFIPTVQRHSVYKTLLATFASETIVLVKDAKNYIDAVYDQKGIAGRILVEFQEYDYASDSYVTQYAFGFIDLKKYTRKRDRTEVGFEADDFIMRVLNRDEVVLDLQELSGMDGSAITPFNDEITEVTLDAQLINKLNKYIIGQSFYIQTYGELQKSEITASLVYVPVNIGSRIDGQLNSNRLNVQEKWYINEVPGHSIEFLESGNITVDFTGLSLTFFLNNYLLASSPFAFLRYQINEDTPVTLSQVITMPSSSLVTPVSATLSSSGFTASINAGDKLRVYVIFTDVFDATEANRPRITAPSHSQINIDISQATTFEDTQLKGMLVWEYVLRICQKITGRDDCLRSSFLGRTDGEVYQYPEDGEGSLFLYSNDYQLRGYPLSPYSLNDSLMAVFKAIDHDIHNIGLGITYENGLPYVVVEKLEYFFERNNILCYFDARDTGVDFSPALEHIFGNVATGYQNYREQETGSLQTPHSTRKYSVLGLSDVINSTYTITSDTVASSHWIELTRRKRFNVNSSKDIPDQSTRIILSVKRSGGGYVRVKDEDFFNVTNLNSTDQSNLLITPARQIIKHSKYLLSGLQKRLISDPSDTDFLRLESGEANLLVTTQLIDGLSGLQRLTLSGGGGTVVTGSIISGNVSGARFQVITVVSSLIFDGVLLSGTFSFPEAVTFWNASETATTGSGFAVSLTAATVGGKIIPEGNDIDLSLLSNNEKQPLFDASMAGTATVKMTKSKRALFRNVLIKGVVGIVDNGAVYFGFVDYIKETNLNNSEAEIRFLRSLTVPEPPIPPDGYILNEDGSIIETEDGFGFLLEDA